MIPEKIAPELLAMRRDRAKMRRSTFARRYSQRGIIADPVNKPVRIIVMIECDAEASFSHLARFGIRVNQEWGRVRTAFLPFRQLGRLSDEPAVRRIHVSESLDTAMDRAVDRAALPAFRAATNLTGRGVIIGLVDSGFDPRHPALRGRILRAWDQLPPHGDGVAEGRYGVELQGQRIEQELCDPRGHGTHVAAIAAGGGTRFPGVAPGAELVLVRSDLSVAHIMDGIQYIFRVAAELGRPAVINLSVASQPGPYDGNEPLCDRIDDSTGPGRIVCCAAGNHGRQPCHAQASLVLGSEVAIPFRCPAGIREMQISGLYPRESQIVIAVGLPDGSLTQLVSNEPSRQELAPGVAIEFSEFAPDPARGRFTVHMTNALVSHAGRWRLVLRGRPGVAGTIDVWLRGDDSDGRIVTQDGLGFEAHVDSGMKICIPGVAASALTVASLTTRNEWRNRFNERQTRDATLHDISPFSSPGPLVDGRPKPDLAAPGAWIIAAQAVNVQAEREAQIDATHSVREGTSMAAAFVSGVVALLLERNPALDPPAIKQMLQAASRIPGHADGEFSPSWGYGMPDLSKLVSV